MKKRLRKKLWKGEFSAINRLTQFLQSTTGLTKGELAFGFHLLGLI